MTDFWRLTRLFDAYGELLAGKQRECLALRLTEDLSLTEIGQRLNISRQAANVNISRGVKVMEDFEAKLGLLATGEAISRLCRDIKGLETSENSAAVAKILAELASLGR